MSYLAIPVFIASALTPVIPVAAAGIWEMTLSGPSSVPNGAKDTAITIKANTSSSVRSWQADITFDPAKIQVKTVEDWGYIYIDATWGGANNFLKSWALTHGNTVDMLQTISFNNTTGHIYGIGQALRVNTGGDAAGGPRGSGILLTIRLCL